MFCGIIKEKKDDSEKNFSKKIQGFIKVCRAAGQRESDGGKFEINFEIPLTGQNGLSRYLAGQRPLSIRRWDKYGVLCQ